MEDRKELSLDVGIVVLETALIVADARLVWLVVLFEVFWVRVLDCLG